MRLPHANPGVAAESAAARPSVEGDGAWAASRTGEGGEKARASFAVRVRRMGSATAHVLDGLATIARVFPRTTAKGRRRLIRRWSAALLRRLGVERRVVGDASALDAANTMVVANHVSWLDVFVLNALHPARFVAKAEIRGWPVVGRLVAGVGTLFIERDRRRDTHKVTRMVAGALAAGDLVAFFPEGTTTDGTKLRPFHGSLLQAVCEVEGQVVPVAIRYLDARGERSGAAPYVDGMNLLQSVWRIVSERRTIAEVTVLPACPAVGRTRRELASEARAAIRTALGSVADGTALGTLRRRRAASR